MKVPLAMQFPAGEREPKKNRIRNDLRNESTPFSSEETMAFGRYRSAVCLTDRRSVRSLSKRIHPDTTLGVNAKDRFLGC